MASQQDIRRRIRSVQNTRKITRALELVAASKLRRAQARIEDMRPYADRMLELMSGTARASTSVRGLPLLQQRDEVRSVAVVPIMGDRGLSGPFNSQVLRRSLAVSRQLQGEGKQVRWVAVGRRGVGSLRFRRFELSGEFTGFTDDPRYADAQAIAHKVIELYTEEEVDRVLVIYNRFESALTQRVTEQELLPLSEEMLAPLLPVYVDTELYRALLESAASKHGAQMTAMRNASTNAGDLIDNLTLAMNRARQAEITQEILEVVAGADALTA